MTDNRDYACAIGTAILAFNETETEIFGLMEALAGADLPPDIEAGYLRDKLKYLKESAPRIADAIVRQMVLEIVAEAERLNDDRNNFAHSLLWTDLFDGTRHRRWVRQKTKEATHDSRTPEQIMKVAEELEELGNRAGALASQIRVSGGR